VVLTRVALGSLEKGVRGVVKGLNAQDRVIIEGVQNVTPGNKVQVQTVQNK
jgi:hypothetical protein